MQDLDRESASRVGGSSFFLGMNSAGLVIVRQDD
jgi:hypothetical protein